MPETPAETTLFMGKAIVVAGDPTTALGADMVPYDEFPTVVITHHQLKQRGSDRSGHQLAGGAYDKGGRVSVAITGYRNQVDELAAFIAGITALGEGYNVADELFKVDPPTVAIIPVAEKLGAIDSGGVYWIPAADSEGDIAMTFDSTTTGDDANATYTFTLQSLKRITDQAGSPLPTGTREYFRGSPNATGRALTWSLPPEFDAPGP